MSSPHSLQPPPPPRPPAGRIGGSQGLWDEFLRHGKRWLVCDFTRMFALPEERGALASASPPITDTKAQDYAAWRRSMVWVGIVFAAVGTVDELVSLLTLKTGHGTGTSSFMSVLQFLTFASHGALLLALILSARSWQRPSSDRRRLRLGWAIALFVPVVMMLLPLSDLLLEDTPENRQMMQDPTMAAGYRGVMGLLLAVTAFWTAIPGLVSVFPGMIRAGTILKTLLPGRAIGPVVALTLGPVYALLLLVICTSVQQIGDSMFILIGSLLLLASPIVGVRAAWDLVAPSSSQDAAARVARYRAVTRIPTFCGLGLILIGLFTAELFGFRLVGYGKVLIQAHSLLLMVAWFFAMLTTYTVVSADGLIQVMHLADEKREDAERSPDFQRDAKALGPIEASLAGPEQPAAEPSV